MKKYKFNILVFLLGLVAFTSCTPDDNQNDIFIETVGRGAILRTVMIEGAALDVLNLSAPLSIQIEEQDDLDGDLLSQVEVFVSFNDNTPSNGVQDPAETLVQTLTAADFTDGPFGLPRSTFDNTLAGLTGALGLQVGDFLCGDGLTVRMVLTLTDGRVFDDSTTSGNIPALNSFFASPYTYEIGIVANLPSDDLFLGAYMLTNLTPDNGVRGPDFAEGVVMITATNNTTRVFDATYLPAIGGFGRTLEFQFVCGEIIFSTVDFGLSCGDADSLVNGPATVNTTYDLANPDDTSFIINYSSNTLNDCVGFIAGTQNFQGSFMLTQM